MQLEELGFRPQFLESFESLNDPTLVPGRVVRADVGWATVRTAEAELNVRVARRVRENARLRPVAGDWTALDSKRELLCHVLPRSSAFVRQAAGKRTEEQVLAANVDTALILMGLDADYNLRRIERYLTLAYQSGALPVVLLTKAGLCGDWQARVARVAAVAPGVAVHGIDVFAGIGLDVPLCHIPRGTTAALLGSSGVGKSTLTNHLLGEIRVPTNSVRARDDRGQHTTTYRELFFIPGAGALVDTPGMRELQLWADSEALENVFSDVKELARGCRFRDCRHQREPGCRVREALDRAEIESERLDSYHALSREIDAHKRRRSEHERRAEGRKLSRAVRQALRAKGRI